MLKVYTDIFDESRLKVWRNLKKVPGYLAGGTALALQIRHRISYDFDIFLDKPINNRLAFKIKEIFSDKNIRVVVDSGDELTVMLDEEIKLSFVYFPFKNLKETLPTESICVADVEDLLANKAYAIGRRGVWRDYVDIYWGLKNKLIDFEDLLRKTEKKFSGLFSRKLFLEQLVYFEGLENRIVDWCGNEISDDDIEKYLENLVREYVRP